MKNKILFIFLIALAGCASKPQLYPNDKLDSVGKDVAQKDIDDCMKKADDFASSSEGKKIAKGAGSGAIIGSVIGGAFGLFTGNVGQGALEGGVVGGAGGATQAAITPDQLKHNFTNQCLADKGYKVIGWD